MGSAIARAFLRETSGGSCARAIPCSAIAGARDPWHRSTAYAPQYARGRA